MKKISLISLLMSYIMMATMCTTHQNTDQKLADSMDSLFNAHYNSDSPGYAIAIVKNDSIIYQSAKGIADLNKQDKIDGNTVFNIASISKQFTVVGILKLHEQGLLNIEDNISKYFPEFKGEIWEKVKIRHLMSQSSGVPDNRPRTDKNFMLYIVDKQCLEYMVDLNELKFEPGSNYDYKNPTFQVLAEIITRVSGMPFEEFQKKNLFDPAGMTNVRYFEPTLEIPQMAHGYINVSKKDNSAEDSDSEKNRDDVKGQYVDGNGYMWMEYDYGEETFFGTKADGGIYTSVNDFIKWEKALRDNVILKKETLDLAYTNQITVSGSKYSSYQNRDNTYYGFGWFIDETPNRDRKIYHTGDNGGFQAYASKYPDSNVNIVMLSNRNDKNRWEMQMEIESILLQNGYIK